MLKKIFNLFLKALVKGGFGVVLLSLVFGIGFGGVKVNAETAILVSQSSNKISCSVELVKSADGQTTIPGSITACEKGENKTGPIKDDGVSKSDCVATRNVDNKADLKGDLICLDGQSKIVFKDLLEGELYFYNSVKVLYIFKNSQGKLITLNVVGLKSVCPEIRADSPRELDCKSITKAEFYQVSEELAKKGTENATIGEANTGTTSTSLKGGQENGENKNILGDIFGILYRIIAMIIFALLFLVRYAQMFILLMFISVMTVLLNLSPNSSFLTTLATPLWGIFAQIANLGAVFILVYLGAATMIGIMNYSDAIKKGTTVALYTFVSSFIYFGLAFIISLLDGFTKLIVLVFGGGSVFKLLENLVASVSSISQITGPGTALVPDLGKGIATLGTTVFGTDTAQQLTSKLIAEIVVVIALFLILIVFKNIFIMLLSRVAILLLLLITSPLWVLGYLVKDSLPQDLKGQMDSAIKVLTGTVIFNFVFIITLVLVTIITRTINDSAASFISNNLVASFTPQINSGLAFIDPLTATAQANTAISDDSFGTFGGPFLKTISVITILSINLVIIQKSFEFVETFIDASVKSAGKLIGDKVNTGLSEFGRAGSLKKAIGGAVGMAGKAITGDNAMVGNALNATTIPQVALNGRLRSNANKTLDGSDGIKIFGKTFGQFKGVGERMDELNSDLSVATRAGDKEGILRIKKQLAAVQLRKDYATQTLDSAQGKNRKNITDRFKDAGQGSVGIDGLKANVFDREINLFGKTLKTPSNPDYDNRSAERETRGILEQQQIEQKKQNDGFIKQYNDSGMKSEYLPDYMKDKRETIDGKANKDYNKLDQRFVQKDELGENTKMYNPKIFTPDVLTSGQNNSIDIVGINKAIKVKDINLGLQGYDKEFVEKSFSSAEGISNYESQIARIDLEAQDSIRSITSKVKLAQEKINNLNQTRFEEITQANRNISELNTKLNTTMSADLKYKVEESIKVNQKTIRDLEAQSRNDNAEIGQMMSESNLQIQGIRDNVPLAKANIKKNIESSRKYQEESAKKYDTRRTNDEQRLNDLKAKIPNRPVVAIPVKSNTPPPNNQNNP